MFIDEAEIRVKAGDGGRGSVSFRREAGVPRGGPDGGHGGDGGSVVFHAREGLDTLLDFRGRSRWRAPSGEPGRRKDQTGASGDDLVINVPPGTLIYDRRLGILLKDLARPGMSVTIARGGKGGRGNASFATPTEQTPRHAEPGEPGEERDLRLELKLIADVGLVGLPNAGKSTLLARLSAARPKIADYPFTTLYPHLGIVEAGPERRFVMADLPGLIEGAHKGVGLGDEFLRHIERTRVLVHLVEVQPHTGQTPADAYRSIRRELEAYSRTLADKEELLVMTKADLLGGDPGAPGVASAKPGFALAEPGPRQELAEAVGRPVLLLSAATGRGLKELVAAILDLLDRVGEPGLLENAP
jgi:GTP-binding protein